MSPSEADTLFLARLADADVRRKDAQTGQAWAHVAPAARCA